MKTPLSLLLLMLLVSSSVLAQVYSPRRLTRRIAPTASTPQASPSQPSAVQPGSNRPRTTPSAVVPGEQFQDVNEALGAIQYKDRTLTNAVLVKIGIETCMVRCDSGGVRMRLEDLPEPARSKYFDPKKLAALIEDRKRAETISRSNYVAQVQANREEWKAQNMRLVNGSLEEIRLWPVIKGTVESREKDGLLIQTEVVTTKTFVDHSSVSGNARIGAYTSGPFTYDKSFTNAGPLVLVRNIPGMESYVTGEHISIHAKQTGTKSFGGVVLAVHDYGLPYVKKP